MTRGYAHAEIRKRVVVICGPTHYRDTAEAHQDHIRQNVIIIMMYELPKETCAPNAIQRA